MNPIIAKEQCRVCRSRDLVPLFSLGEQFVSDFVSADQITAGVRAPLCLDLCRECTLVQLRHTAPQELLYARHYWYRSGVTQSMRDALADVCRTVEQRAELKSGDVVCDVGSNDGTLLRSYAVPGLIRVGVEPATNLADEGRQGIDWLDTSFWPSSDYLGRYAGHTRAVTACGMFYDLDEPGAFIRGVAEALAPDGLFVAQLMCLKQTVEKKDVGNICHEHLEFYSLRSLLRLFNDNGLELYDLEENTVNGGSYRLFARKAGYRSIQTRKLKNAMAREAEMGLDNPELYRGFFDELRAAKRKVVDFVLNVVGSGGRVHVYGASTKGNVILQWFNLGSRQIEAAVERTPSKWGKYTIGTGIHIISEDVFRTMNPEYAIILPYAFESEMVAREALWLKSGGRFILPLPIPRIVDAGPDGAPRSTPL